MNNIELMNYWIKSSEEDNKVMKVLFENKKNSYALFFGHLSIEKLIKALYAKNNKNNPYAPKSHDLLYLAKKSNLDMNEDQEDLLDTITKFNISARYDIYKNEFSKKCTDEYTKKQISNIKEVRRWLKEQLKMQK